MTQWDLKVEDTVLLPASLGGAAVVAHTVSPPPEVTTPDLWDSQYLRPDGRLPTDVLGRYEEGIPDPSCWNGVRPARWVPNFSYQVTRTPVAAADAVAVTGLVYLVQQGPIRVRFAFQLDHVEAANLCMTCSAVRLACDCYWAEYRRLIQNRAHVPESTRVQYRATGEIPTIGAIPLWFAGGNTRDPPSVPGKCRRTQASTDRECCPQRTRAELHRWSEFRR